MKEKIYDDIFEAIRQFEPDNALLNLKEVLPWQLKRNNSFNLMQMPNGKVAAFPKNFLITLYRGEDDDYDAKCPCMPSIFRNNPTDGEILINKLKVIDFSLILKDHPKVEKAEKDGLDIHYDALAQHYGLKTDLLDLTSDIAVAAFFATNTYNQRERSYVPKKKGLGYIRCYKHHQILLGDLNNLELIGLQPLERPTMQHAFGIKLSSGEDFSNKSNKVVFRQNVKYSKKINKLFCKQGFNPLFPVEDDICNIAKDLNDNKEVSKEAITLYCKRNNMNTIKLINEVKEMGYKISNDKLYRLTRQRKRDIRRKMADNLYGNIKINTRFCSY